MDKKMNQAISRRARTRASRRTQPRRGVTLLVVLTLLAMFIIVCTTMLLLAGTNRRAAQSNLREEWYGDPPQKLLDAALYQVVRGTPDPRSEIGLNDLLSDLYGYDGFIALGSVQIGQRQRHHFANPGARRGRNERFHGRICHAAADRPGVSLRMADSSRQGSALLLQTADHGPANPGAGDPRVFHGQLPDVYGRPR
jgi:hypothetical protein